MKNYNVLTIDKTKNNHASHWKSVFGDYHHIITPKEIDTGQKERSSNLIWLLDNIYDYSGLETDFVHVWDNISLSHLTNPYSKNNYEFFNDKLFMYEICSPDVIVDNGDNILNAIESMTSTLKSIATYGFLESFIYADIIQCNDYSITKIKPIIEYFYSQKIVDTIMEKMILLPPFSVYKALDLISYEDRDFTKLSFLWNHRLTDQKDPSLFFKVLASFHKKYPQVPIEIHFICPENKRGGIYEKNIDPCLEPFIVLYDWLDSKAEYKRVIEKTNVSLCSAKYESYGISNIEAIRNGLLFYNLNLEAFQFLFTDETTYNADDMLDVLYRSWTDKEFRDEQYYINLNAINKLIPAKEEAFEVMNKKMTEVFDKKTGHLSSKFKNRDTVFKRIKDQKVLSKREVYNILGWDIKSSKYWGGIYFKMRRSGINFLHYNGEVFFYNEEKHSHTDAFEYVAEVL